MTCRRARLFFAMVTPAAGASTLMRRLLPLIPRWAGHFGQHAVLDGDNVFLHVQVPCLLSTSGISRV